jgi:hypothetical protein
MSDNSPNLAFVTTDELMEELSRRHEALIISGCTLQGTYYTYRVGKGLMLRGLVSLVLDEVLRRVRETEREG